MTDKLAKTNQREISIAIPEGSMVNQDDYIELAANLMGLAQGNMRRDLVRIAVEEFDYIIRRRREIAVQTLDNQGVLEFISRKEAALQAGEYTIDTTSGKLHFLNAELQPWL